MLKNTLNKVPKIVRISNISIIFGTTNRDKPTVLKTKKMKTTDFTFATKEIESRIFDELTCKKLKWCEASKEQNEAINSYPCEIKNAPNGFTAIFIERFAEISNPDFGSFFAKTESGIEKIIKYVESGIEFEIVGDEVK